MPFLLAEILNFQGSTHRIGVGSFSKLYHNNIPNGVTDIMDDSFAYTKALEKVTMPDTVTYIGYWAFNNCINLKDINISKKCTVIGQFALQSTAITTIHIPASVEWIMTYCFSGCAELESITVDKNNARYYAQDGVLYANKDLIWYPAKKNTEVFYVPDGICTIQPYVFSYAQSLKEIYIPESVGYIDRGTFWDCNSLEKVYFPYSIKKIEELCFANVQGVNIYGYDNTCVEKFCKEGVDSSTLCTYISSGKYEKIEKDTLDALTLSAKKDGSVIPNDKIAWKSEDKSIATVKNGVVTFLSGGTAIIKGVYGDYTFVYEIEVKQKDISKAKVTLSSTSYSYDGGEKKPVVTITLNGKTLAKDTDYTVSYKNNIKVGTATVTITGKRGYVGTINRTFTIGKASISKAKVTLSATSYNYSGKANKPTVKSVILGKKTLKNGTDYTVTYKNNTKVGTATVTIKGKGNYVGTVSKTFTIKAVSLSKAKVTLATTSYNYDGKAKKPVVKSVVLGEKTLKNGTDYKVTYKNNTKAGTATVVITGKGKYAGTVNKSFIIKVKTGTAFTSGAYKYKVTGTSTVAFTGLKSTSTTKVVIPATVKYAGKTYNVTSIASKALKGKTKVKSVTIGTKVTTIGASAFEGCKKLKTITISSKVLKTVGKKAFKGIDSKATIKVPKAKLSKYKTVLKNKGQGSKVSIK